jgi:hypothetical protein
MDHDLLDRAIVASIPVIIKAKNDGNTLRRLVEVQASSEAMDYDGDVILQKALLDSAASFIANGHIDIDHYSEFGARLGIANPASYVIGRPLEVKALANKDTWVLCEISRSGDGTFDPVTRKYDEIWASLLQNPPVKWYSSVYGFPVDIDDCTRGVCSHGATRWVIKSMDWRSLAFTRKPKNESLTGHAKIVTARMHLAELAKSINVPISLPTDMMSVWASRICPNCRVHEAPSLIGLKRHLTSCKSCPEGLADILAHAMMYRYTMSRAVR